MHVFKKISFILCLIFVGCFKTTVPIPENIHVTFGAAPSIPGYDFLGLAKQNCSYIAQQIDPGTGLGELQGTFGDIRPCLTNVLGTHKVIADRVHNIDGTVSNHACTGNVVSLSYLSTKLKLMAAFAANYPQVTWYDSPVLEHGCTDPRIVNGWFAQLKKDWPTAIPVCSSNGRGYCPPGVLKENHGGGKGDTTSFDGVNGYDQDASAFQSSGKYLSMFWTPCGNGRVTGANVPVPLPQNRVDFCTNSDIRQWVLLMRPAQSLPNVPGCQYFKKPELLKTNAEYYGKAMDDGRGNKPMTILNNKYSRISLQTLQGKEVGFMTYYGSYGAQSRNYIGSRYGSNQTPAQLYDAFGGEWGLAKMGGKCYYFNAIRRQGFFY